MRNKTLTDAFTSLVAAVAAGVMPWPFGVLERREAGLTLHDIIPFFSFEDEAALIAQLRKSEILLLNKAADDLETREANTIPFSTGIINCLARINRGIRRYDDGVSMLKVLTYVLVSYNIGSPDAAKEIWGSVEQLAVSLGLNSADWYLEAKAIYAKAYKIDFGKDGGEKPPLYEVVSAELGRTCSNETFVTLVGLLARGFVPPERRHGIGIVIGVEAGGRGLAGHPAVASVIADFCGDTILPSLESVNTNGRTGHTE